MESSVPRCEQHILHLSPPVRGNMLFIGWPENRVPKDAAETADSSVLRSRRFAAVDHHTVRLVWQ